MLKTIVFFVTIFLFTLVLTIPMNWVYSIVKSKNAPVVLSQINGTIWSGSASVDAPFSSPRYTADNWKWSFNLSQLLQLKLNWNVSHRAQKIEANVGSTLLSLGRDFDMELISNVNTLAHINPIFNLVSGNFSAHVEDFNTPTCIKNSGDITLSNFDAMNFKLKKIKASITCDNAGAFAIKYDSEDSALNINGKITIDSKGFYNSSMTASSTDNNVTQSLANIAHKKLSKGKFLIQGSGYLK